MGNIQSSKSMNEVLHAQLFGFDYNYIKKVLHQISTLQRLGTLKPFPTLNTHLWFR